jgi:hypothetical protein
LSHPRQHCHDGSSKASAGLGFLRDDGLKRMPRERANAQIKTESVRAFTRRDLESARWVDAYRHGLDIPILRVANRHVKNTPEGAKT